MPNNHRTEFLSWDDKAIISENPVVNRGLSLDALFTAFQTEVLNLWHPLTLWSHQLDVTLFGLNPDLHHLSALLYHLLAGLALYCAVLQIKTPKSFDPATSQQPLLSKTTALITTLLFLLHPMHIESWAWLSERKDTLSTLFAFLSLNYWARFISGGATLQSTSRGLAGKTNQINYSLSLIFLTCGLLSKPSLIVWPAVLLLLSNWQNPKKHLKDHLPTLKLLIPHTLACLIIATITYRFQLGRGEDLLAVFATRPLHQNLITGFNNIWIYTYKLFLPLKLSYFYPPLEVYPFKGFAAGLLLFITLSFLSWKHRFRFPLLAFAWGSFFIILAPVCGFIISGEANAPDRYSYLAYTGPFLLLVTLAPQLLQKIRLTPQQQKITLAALTVFLLAAYTTYATIRAPHWENMETLTQAAIKSHPESYAPHHHLALQYLGQNNPTKARPHIEQSLKLREGNRYLWAELGKIELAAGNPEAAIQHFQKQLVHAPNNPNAHAGLAKVFLKQNNPQAALSHLQKASQLDPQNKSFQQAIQQILQTN